MINNSGVTIRAIVECSPFSFFFSTVYWWIVIIIIIIIVVVNIINCWNTGSYELFEKLTWHQ
jgi:hypothetical protein